MRIGIDNVSPGESTSRSAPGGMRTYVQTLVQEFTRQRPGTQFVLFTPDWADAIVDTEPPNLEVIRLRGVPRGRIARVVYQQTVLPRAIDRSGLDAMLATATVAPLASKTPIVLAVQFIQFYDMPAAYGWLRTSYLKYLVGRSIRKAAFTYTFTETARTDLIRHTHCAAERVRVIPHGVEPALERAADAIAPGHVLTGGAPYVLYVSATYGYKNHARLIRAFGHVKQQSQIPHKLLLAGAEEAVPFETLRREARESNVERDVVLAGRVPDARALYRDADLSVMPSLYETFGFPVLEAMSSGCPLVTSNYGAMAELAGDAAVLVDPRDERSIASGITHLLSDLALRAELVARGRTRASEFTWERAARSTLHLLELASGRSQEF